MTLNELGSQNGVTLVELAGHMGLNAVQDIEKEFKKATVSRGAPAVIDLSGVTYISSFGVRMFLDTIQELETKGKRVVFVAPQKDVEKVLIACEMDSLAGLEATREAAFAKLGA